jgi:Pyruvate/2-oxoacid:ferredoxin oxidoreductase gamma subunit
VFIDALALGEQMVVNEITVHALLVTGVDVKKSEVHGLTQRGNKVVVHLRYGSRFYSPVISHRLRSMLRWHLKR